MPDDIQLAAALMQSVTGEPPTPLTSLDEVGQTLAAGRLVLVELPWREQRHDGFVETHQILVTRLEGDRVYFQNALKNPRAVGSEIGGPDAGPLRRLEADGQESMAHQSFQVLMSLGGRALSPQQG